MAASSTGPTTLDQIQRATGPTPQQQTWHAQMLASKAPARRPEVTSAGRPHARGGPLSPD